MWYQGVKPLVLLVSFLGSGVVAGSTQVNANQHVPVLSERQIVEDRNQAAKFVEDNHPFFLLAKDLTPYKAAKFEYFNETQTSMNVKDFELATAKFLSFFKDRQSYVFVNKAREHGCYLCMPSSWGIHENEVYYFDSYDGKKLNVTKVGGIEVGDILKKIDYIFPSGTEVQRSEKRKKHFISIPFLEYCGVDTSKGSVTLTFNDGTVTDCDIVDKRHPFFNFFNFFGSNPEKNENSTPFGNYFYKDGDILIVRISSSDDFACELGPLTPVLDSNIFSEEGYLVFGRKQLGNKYKSISQSVKKAIDGGCKKVVLDFRLPNYMNELNIAIFEKILNAMGMKLPEFGAGIVDRKDAYLEEFYGRRRKTKNYFPADPKCIKNKDIDLVVLCSKDMSYKSTMLCTLVKDGKLGTLIGTPCMYSPNACSDRYNELRLKNSDVYMLIPCVRYLRPNGNIYDNSLKPDIEVSDDGEALGRALEFLKEK